MFDFLKETNEEKEENRKWEKGGVGNLIIASGARVFFSRPKLGMTVERSGVPKSAIFGLRIKF